MIKIKNYNVGWSETRSVTVTAKNMKEAEDIVLNGEFENDESREFEGILWVTEE